MGVVLVCTSNHCCICIHLKWVSFSSGYLQLFKQGKLPFLSLLDKQPEKKLRRLLYIFALPVTTTQKQHSRPLCKLYYDFEMNCNGDQTSLNCGLPVEHVEDILMAIIFQVQTFDFFVVVVVE